MMARGKPPPQRLDDLFANMRRYNIKGKTLAAACGISESTLSRWKEHGKSPRALHLDAAEEALAGIVKAIRSGKL